MIVDYKVVTGEGDWHGLASQDLEQQVREWIKHGWQPLGGVSSPTDFFCQQAMVLEVA